MATEFEKLIAELDQMEPMAKALGTDPADDKAKDKKASASDPAEDKAEDKRVAAAAEEGEKESDKDKTFGKSFTVTLDNGETTEAFDGTEAIRALHDRAAQQDEQIADMQKAFGIALGVIKDMRETIGSQADLLKSMGTKVASAAAAPAGRRTMVSIAEKMAPAEAARKAEPTANSVMLKAQFMCRNNQLGWEALPRIEAFQGRGQLAPPDLLARFPELLAPVNGQ